MKTIPILLAAAISAFAQQSFDFTTLDKLGANAKNRTKVTLDSGMLKLAAGFLGDDTEADSIRSLVNNLTGIYVRAFEFDKPGQYNESDLAPLRNYVKAWTKIVDVEEGKEKSEIYAHLLPGGKLGGVAIISAEPTEVTVVYINGNLNPADLAKLGGNFGIPDLHDLQNLNKLGGKSGKSKEEE